ncbi:hypothetical protein GCM10007276_09300 [Agaricicola taiwanensis]|uniref:Uncharacterized protein n=1 Tax=Agaricicola taiwanensis TaxID=591372 RepID=A0A8J2YBQ9_9RHOB|nr:DUF2076 family protein [Agaricicola taiwanensis]GGE34086.1 hypothetical protein GCM10007276_09300 [Agaricicola taiwanensis]
MTEQERLLIDALFDRLAVIDTASHDRETEGFILEKLKGNPSLAYTLAQTVLMQNQELAAAEARIVNLQAELDRQDGTSSRPFKRDDLRVADHIGRTDATGFLASAAAVTLAVTSV